MVRAGRFGLLFFGQGSDLENFYLKMFPLDNLKKFVTMKAIYYQHVIFQLSTSSL